MRFRLHTAPALRRAALGLLTLLCIAATCPPTLATASMAPVAIWAAPAPPPGSVLLFRQRFTTTDPLTDAALHIFADTRYEAWLDGAWLGRGPARFSHARQEYDSLPVGKIAPGEHVLAVLVHYAPNKRRSESLGGGLYAWISASSGGEPVTLAASGEHWRVLVSPAWNAQAQQVHQWHLLGPQELLDLRRLPADWMQPGFDDRDWPRAAVLPPGTFPHLQPRSIPLLTFVPRAPLAVLETGLLAPGQRLIDIDDIDAPPGAGPTRQLLPLQLDQATPLTIETTTTSTLQLALAGRAIEGWQPLNEPRRPDAHRIVLPLPAGAYTLEVQAAAGGGALLLPASVPISTSLAQGSDAGRRMLLAHPVPGGEAAPVVTLADGRADARLPASATPRYLLLDFGRTLHARPALLAQGPPGTIIDIGWDERLRAGRALPAPGSLHQHLWSQVDSWVLDGTPRRLTTLDTRAGRYMLILVWGDGPVRLEGIHALEETMVRSVPGAFSSSEPRLDRIWQVGVDTLIPSTTDAYADPWRERGQWWGDAFVAWHANRVSIGDMALWRRGLRQMGESMSPDGALPSFAPAHGDTNGLLDYNLLWVEGLYRYWKLSGDDALLRELLPQARRVLRFIQRYENEHGLLFTLPVPHRLTHDLRPYTGGFRRSPVPAILSKQPGVLIDWSAWDSRFGESTPLNALYSAALGRMAAMVAATGGEDAPQYARRSSQVRTALYERLYLPDEGAYAATRYGETIIAPAPQAQAWALVYGVVPLPQRQRVAAHMLEEMQPFWGPRGFARVEIYGFFWLLDALGQTGRTSEALALIREHYGRMLDMGATTWWENFISDRRYDNSLSHAWGSAPTWFLSTYVLGAQTTSAQGWRVAPQPGEIQQASGSIPLPGGELLQVDWQQHGCGQLTLEVQAPAASAGEVRLPLRGDEMQVMLDGRQVWPPVPGAAAEAERRGDALHIQVGGQSSYALQSRTACATSFLPLLRPAALQEAQP